MNFRPQRVSNLIREELSLIIVREVEFAPGKLITITDVEIDKKLDIARVKVSVLPAEYAPQALTILAKAAGDLQWKTLKKINIRPMPRLIFEIDRGLENAANVEKLLLDK